MSPKAKIIKEKYSDLIIWKFFMFYIKYYHINKYKGQMIVWETYLKYIQQTKGGTFLYR